MIQLSNLEHTRTDIPRIPNEAEACFNRWNFYYIDKYPSEKVLAQQIWDVELIPLKYDPIYYYNIDYRMLKHHNDIKCCNQFGQFLFFLVTSIDQKGIISPLCSEEFRNFHPGGKRTCLAGYLDIPNLPIVLQTKDSYDYKKIFSLEELASIYENKCSFIHRPEYDTLEVVWHGETLMRDGNGYDDWFYKAQTIKDVFPIDIMSTLLESGLDIENNSKEITIKNNIFKTNFCKSSSSPIKIKILDDSLLDLDFWELYFHIDPRVYMKVDTSEKIIIINNLAKEKNVMYNCGLLKTLKRKKFFNKEKLKSMRQINGKEIV